MNKTKALLFWLLGLMLLLLVNPCVLLAQEGRQMRNDRNMQEKSPDADQIRSSDVKRSPLRAILNKVTIGANLGYGMNYYSQKLPYSILQEGDNHYLLTQSNAVSTGYSNWLNSPKQYVGLRPGDADGLVQGDTANLRLRGFGSSLPIGLDLHVVLADRFRIGGGLGFEIFSVRSLDFKNGGSELSTYNAGVNSALAWRYYGMVGARVISWGNWDHSVDFRLGKKNFLTQFDGADPGAFFNLGFMMERNYSEYFRFTLRPSLEWFSHTTNIGELAELKTNTPSLYIQAGVNLNFPRVPRCPMKACQTQLEHLHNGKEFRGQPIYRWQNPKYGQNHPELQRNLKRNKDDTEQRLQKRPNRKQSPGS